MSDRHIVSVLDPFDPDHYLTREDRAEAAAGFRRLADWIETTRFPIPRTVFHGDALEFKISGAWIHDESFVGRVSSAARLIGGTVKKGLAWPSLPDSSPFTLTREFGGGVNMIYSVDRNAVCEAREVTETAVEKRPADPVLAESLEAGIKELQDRLGDIEKVEITVPITKKVYKCPPALAEAERRNEEAMA